MQVKTIEIHRNTGSWNIGDAGPGEYYGYINLGSTDSDVKVKIDKHSIDKFIKYAADIAMFQLDRITHENTASTVIAASLTRLQEIPQQTGLPLSQDEE